MSSDFDLFRHQSLLAWSCGHPDTMPSLGTFASLQVDRFGSSVGVFTELRRYYTIQPVKDNCRTRAGPVREQAADQSSDLSHQPTADTSVHDVQSHSTDSVARTPGSEEKHLDGADALQQMDETSNEASSQNDMPRKVGLVQRFRMMYKQYGVVLVSMHAITSSVWVSLLYFATVR